jgi:hypothetical protein
MPGSAPVSLGCTATLRPPRSGSASAGGATASENGPSSCCSVACSTRTGTASFTICTTLTRSLAAAAPISSTAASHSMLFAPSGTITAQVTSFALPAASTTSCGGSASGTRAGVEPGAGVTVPTSEARSFISRAVVLRNVSRAWNWSPLRTSGGRPGSTCRSCVTRMLVEPVPKVCTPASATATRRKPVSESLRGTSTTASPFASSGTRAFHSNKVSNSSRVPPRPPPPPAATALRPKWRRPMISPCAVLVSTPQARSRIIAFSRSHELLSRSASKPSSTAANATSAPAAGLPPCVTLTRTNAFCRIVYCALSAATLTCNSCAAVPTFSAATPSLKAGLDRSTSAVGAWYSRPSYT